MNFKTIGNMISSKAARQILVARKHSPTMLFVVGVAGVVGATVLASRATLKLEDVLKDAQEDLEKARTLESDKYSEQDRQRDIALVYTRTAIRLGRLYGPALAVGTVAIAALTGSHAILSRRNVALTAAYAALDRGFREYRSRVVHEFGADKDRELRYNLQERTIVEETEEGPVTTRVRDVVPQMVSIYARFFDKTCPSWSPQKSYNQMFVQCQQSYANDKLGARGHLFLNEVYDMLGMPHTKEGAIVGWLKNGKGDGFVDFGVFEGNIDSATRFVLGHEDSILLDFNVDGIIYDQI